MSDWPQPPATEPPDSGRAWPETDRAVRAVPPPPPPPSTTPEVRLNDPAGPARRAWELPITTPTPTSVPIASQPSRSTGAVPTGEWAPPSTPPPQPTFGTRPPVAPVGTPLLQGAQASVVRPLAPPWRPRLPDSPSPVSSRRLLVGVAGSWPASSRSSRWSAQVSVSASRSMTAHHRTP